MRSLHQPREVRPVVFALNEKLRIDCCGFVFARQFVPERLLHVPTLGKTEKDEDRYQKR